MNMGNSIKLGDIYYFEKGKKDRFISHTDYGKVIIAENCSSRGFAEVTSFDDREKVIIAKVKRCLYDYYEDMRYEDFKELLVRRGYKIAFEQPFKAKYRMYEKGRYTDEMRLVAYSEKLHMIIVADTFEAKSTFNSIDCYCYGVNCLRLSFLREKLLSMGSSTCTVFDLCKGFPYSSVYSPLHSVEAFCVSELNFKIDRSDVPSGWTYADNPSSSEDFDYFTDKFLNQCPKELRDWFE